MSTIDEPQGINNSIFKGMFKQHVLNKAWGKQIEQWAGNKLWSSCSLKVYHYFVHSMQQELVEKVLGACVIEACMVVLGSDWVKQRLQKPLLTLHSPLTPSNVVLKCVCTHIQWVKTQIQDSIREWHFLIWQPLPFQWSHLLGIKCQIHH